MGADEETPEPSARCSKMWRPVERVRSLVSSLPTRRLAAMSCSSGALSRSEPNYTRVRLGEIVIRYSGTHTHKHTEKAIGSINMTAQISVFWWKKTELLEIIRNSVSTNAKKIWLN